LCSSPYGLLWWTMPFWGRFLMVFLFTHSFTVIIPLRWYMISFKVITKESHICRMEDMLPPYFRQAQMLTPPPQLKNNLFKNNWIFMHIQWLISVLCMSHIQEYDTQFLVTLNLFLMWERWHENNWKERLLFL
jgi:hypothetical protein